MLKHLIFTNFGVGITDELWLTYRLEILLNTVSVSLAAQTNQNFEWHVFIDQRLPNLHRMRLEGLKSAIPRLVLHEVDDYSRIIISINQIARATPCKLLITSRIDDDDCLHVSAVDRIQKAALADAQGTRISIVALGNGLEYLPTDGMARPVRHPTIALGLSLIDRSGSATPLVVSSYGHHVIRETLSKQNVAASYIEIEGQDPMYLYTRHQLSDSYYFGARARVLQDPAKLKVSDALLRQFGLDSHKEHFLRQTLTQSPLGMPYKYLEQLSLVRQKIQETARQSAGNGPAAGATIDEMDVLLAKKRKLERRATRHNPVPRGNAKVRVAILGSCVTSGLFDLQKTYLDKFEVCFHSARGSMVSALSTPNTDARLRIPQNGLEAKHALHDLEKSTWDQLEASRPDLVVVDLIDERLGLIQHQGSIYSASMPMIKAFERANIGHEVIRPWNEVAMNLRQWAAKPFLERVHGICSTIFLHRAQWAESYLDKDQIIRSFADSPFAKLIELNNRLIREAFSALDNSYISFESIGGMDPGIMLAGGKHLWAFAPYNYDERYYRSLAKQFVSRIT